MTMKIIEKSVIKINVLINMTMTVVNIRYENVSRVKLCCCSSRYRHHHLQELGIMMVPVEEGGCYSFKTQH